MCPPPPPPPQIWTQHTTWPRLFSHMKLRVMMENKWEFNNKLLLLREIRLTLSGLWAHLGVCLGGSHLCTPVQLRWGHPWSGHARDLPRNPHPAVRSRPDVGLAGRHCWLCSWLHLDRRPWPEVGRGNGPRGLEAPCCRAENWLRSCCQLWENQRKN